ncbi:MAG: FHA domain-containing protein [Clostridiales bacterium]|nr:FHA domain-containing protein [Clostridiales bacterium]
MNLIRCTKGHYYDQDKNGANCPYCAQIAAKNQSAAAPQAATASAATAQPKPTSTPTPVPKSRTVPATHPGEQPQPPVTPTTPPVVPAPTHAQSEEDDNCTVGYYSRVIGVEPVVGWLVCTEGEYKGESFKLKSGRNFIGRAANMDVVLSADHSISRFKHAAVIYEPRSRQFIVATGESRELCYLNGNVVLSNQAIQAYDMLDLGNTRLMLIPCCGERFSWEDGLEAPKKSNEKH